MLLLEESQVIETRGPRVGLGSMDALHYPFYPLYRALHCSLKSRRYTLLATLGLLYATLDAEWMWSQDLTRSKLQKSI